MAQYKTDLRDVYFNLFDMNQVQNNSSDYDENDLKDIIEQFDKFTANEIYPTREEGDKEGVKLVDKKVITPDCFKKSLKAFYENGWFGLGYPEEIGGIPAPEAVTSSCISIANGANVSWAMFYGLSRALLNVFLEIGSEEQKSTYIPKLMSGEWGGTMCLTEAGAGSDVGALTSTATPLGDGKYKIKGVKQFITCGDNDFYENIIHLVLARTPGAPKGVKGLSLFVVPKYLVNPDGTMGVYNNVEATKIEEKMGIHASPTCELTFGGDGECVGEIIGKELEGMINMFLMMNEVRLYTAVQGESQANIAVELTKPYTFERVQFGTEIINLPDVKRTFLRSRALSRGMRALVYYTSNLFDKAKNAEGEEKKKIQAEIALLTPICKGYCTDGGFKVAVDAVQIHGGYGYCSEYGIEQFVRDSKIFSIYEGTNGIQAIDYVTRKILKDGGKAFRNMGAKIQNTLEKKEASLWKSELELMIKSMKACNEIATMYGKLAMEKKINNILETATDFLDFSGNLVTSWMLLEQAIMANSKMDGANQEDKKYYQSKIIDYKVFCRQYLSENEGLAYSILNFKESLADFEVHGE